ncbi:LysR substrate-binding domain-containing protein [Streptomyces sp. NPDC056491]|uniref:LysR substrate-binding domain-containing protein n=1 Tax=Streptomyces sp. NPDC056491 TaxID=3345837 RepID=UPI0036B8AB04
MGKPVGRAICDRGRGGAAPIPAGERAVALARRILRMYEVLGAEAGAAGRGAVDGVLRIAAFRSAALHLLPPTPHLLPPALERLAARYPGIRPGNPDPKGLALMDWDENCGSCTRSWWRAQDWIPRATVTAEDDAILLTMAGRGLGMAIMPKLSLREATEAVDVTDLGPERPVRQVGYVTTAESALTLAARALIRELRSEKG